MTAPTLPFNLTTRDHQAVAAYERECARTGEAPTDQGRAEWIAEWADLDDEIRQDAAQMEWRERMAMAGWTP